MQMSAQSILSRSNNVLSHYFQDFFDPEPQDTKEIRLLPVEPLFQRRLFLKKAIASQRPVFLQLDPLTNAGHTVNVRGVIRPMNHGRFLITAHNLTYVFHLHQLRYIAG